MATKNDDKQQDAKEPKGRVLKFMGRGEWPGVPARDLTEEEAMQLNVSLRSEIVRRRPDGNALYEWKEVN